MSINTEEEAESYTSLSRDICAKVIKHFELFGCAQLDKVLEIVTTGQSTYELFSDHVSWGYYPKAKELPFMLAVLHELSVPNLAMIIEEFDIDPVDFITDIDYNDEKIPSRNDLRVDGRVFCLKMVEAFTYLDRRMARELFTQEFTHSSVAVAFIAGGECRGIADRLIDEEYAEALGGKFSSTFPVQAALAENAYYIDHREHLPSGSALEFFEKSGSWNSHVLKKTLYSCAAWENLISLRANNLGENNQGRHMLDDVLDPAHLAVNGDKVRMMLSNLTMDTTEGDFTFSEVVESVLAWIEDSPMAGYAQKITFALSLARMQLRYPTSGAIPFDELFCSKVSEQPHAFKMHLLMVKHKHHLLQALIDETLEMPDDHVGFNHLSLPALMHNIQMPRQKIRKGSFEAYLNKVATISDQFILQGPVPEYKGLMNTLVDQGLSLMLNTVSQILPLDPAKLNLEDPVIADKLIRWGLDINAIPNPTDKSLATALERDLGL